jgi:dihydrofolate reductase
MWSDETAELMKDYWSKIDTMVMGRKTYDIAAAGAPKSKSKKKKNPYGNIETFVFSRTLKAGKHDDITVIRDHPGEFVRALKEKDGNEICVMGGGEIGTTLLEAGVVDEIGFCIHPLLLGSGIPLFHTMSKQIDLELIECRPFKNGCVYVIYRVKN